jgi:hypothetical protein
MQGMCESFAKDHEEVIKDMHAAMMHAFSHFVESVYSYPCMQRKSDEISALEKEAQEVRHNESAKRKRVRNAAAAAAASQAEDGVQQEPSTKKPKHLPKISQPLLKADESEEDNGNMSSSGSSSSDCEEED